MALILILIFVIYDRIMPSLNVEYVGKVMKLYGRVTGIKGYDRKFGEKTFRLRVEDGPKEIPKFFVKIKENRLFTACGISSRECNEGDKKLDNLIYGRNIRCKGKFEKFDAPVNPGEFDSKTYYANLGIIGNLEADEIIILREGFSVNGYFHKINSSISEKYHKILGSQAAGSLSAMILGDKSNLDEEIKKLYQDNSISHLLAISGLHISLVGGAIYLFLKKLKISFYFPLFFASATLVLYGIFTGFSVSAARAIIMMCIFFFSFIIGKSYDLPSSLSLAAIIIMFFNHKVIYQSGFQLSFLAVIGIFYIMPELMYICNLQNYNQKGIKKVGYFFLSLVFCSLSVNIATLPVVLLNFYEISLVGIFLNIIVIPLMSVLVITGLFGGFIALISETVGGFILGASYYILNFYTSLCRIGDTFVFLRLILGKPEKWQVFIYYLLLFILFSSLSLRRRKEQIEKLKNNSKIKFNHFRHILFTFVSLAFSFAILTYRLEEFSINMLDIGQGDCFVIHDGSKNVYISDCGSTTVDEVGKKRLLPFLKSKGWSKVNTIFVSHMDKDHVNGVNDLLNCPEIDVERVVISVSYKSKKLNCEELNKLKKLTKNRNISLLYMKKDDEIKENGVKFRCLYPKGDEVIEDQNEASIVMRMEYKNISVLFTGDIASRTEEEVMKYSDEKELNCDILKVCHHGSKNSSLPEFLRIVDPKMYMISCGLMNRYGHPHKDTLERMVEEGGKILRTDHMGYVEITLNKSKISAKYNSKDLSGKEYLPTKECDCEDCTKLKVNTHFK